MTRKIKHRARTNNGSGAMLDNTESHAEGRVARAIESQTSKLPSDTFLWLAGGAIAGAVLLRALGRREDAIFVGEWAPTFLILGLYNKLVKVAGHDQEHPQPGHAGVEG